MTIVHIYAYWYLIRLYFHILYNSQYLGYLYLLTHIGVKYVCHIIFSPCRLTVTRRVLLLVQELLAFPKHLCLFPGSRCPIFSFLLNVLYIIGCLVVHSLVVILLSNLRFTAYLLVSSILSYTFSPFCIFISIIFHEDILRHRCCIFLYQCTTGKTKWLHFIEYKCRYIL